VHLSDDAPAVALQTPPRSENELVIRAGAATPASNLEGFPMTAATCNDADQLPWKRMSWRRILKSKSEQVKPFGCLRDPLPDLSLRVQHLTGERTGVVWVDDRGDIFFNSPNEVVQVPTHWIVGTYTTGMSASDIEDDLRSFLRERSRNWLID